MVVPKYGLQTNLLTKVGGKEYIQRLKRDSMRVVWVTLHFLDRLAVMDQESIPNTV